jgi:AraC family transcriptional regulator of adaptative response / DNA-3-methyladenine glycosylase II
METRFLAAREPFDGAGLIAFLGARAIAGAEEGAGGVYRRSLRLRSGAALIEVRSGTEGVKCSVECADRDDADATLRLVARLFDLDADPTAIARALRRDPALRPLVAACPGRRVPGCVDGFEIGVRAILGQQVTVAAARTLAGRLVERCGEGGLDGLRLFPSPAAVAEAKLEKFGMPGARVKALQNFARACADGLRLEPGVDVAETRAQLLALPGIGPWTVEYVAMRALGDNDAFPATDLGVRHALARLEGTADPELWRPYRAYGAAHLWASL